MRSTVEFENRLRFARDFGDCFRHNTTTTERHRSLRKMLRSFKTPEQTERRIYVETFLSPGII